MPRLVRNWTTGSYPGSDAAVGPPWQNTTSGGRMPGSGTTSGLVGGKNSPGTVWPATTASWGSDRDARSGATTTPGGADRRCAEPEPSRATANTAWASTGVVPCTTADRPSGLTTPTRLTHGCSTSRIDQVPPSGPYAAACSTTIRYRPAGSIRATNEP